MPPRLRLERFGQATPSTSKIELGLLQESDRDYATAPVLLMGRGLLVISLGCKCFPA